MVTVHSYVSLPEGRDGFMMCHGQYIYIYEDIWFPAIMASWHQDFIWKVPTSNSWVSWMIVWSQALERSLVVR